MGLFRRIIVTDDCILTCSIRSIRHDECSGLAPSNPWGRSKTIPLCLSHLAARMVNSMSRHNGRKSYIQLTRWMYQWLPVESQLVECDNRGWSSQHNDSLEPRWRNLRTVTNRYHTKTTANNAGNHLSLPNWQQKRSLPASTIFKLSSLRVSQIIIRISGWLTPITAISLKEPEQGQYPEWLQQKMGFQRTIRKF